MGTCCQCEKIAIQQNFYGETKLIQQQQLFTNLEQNSYNENQKETLFEEKSNEQRKLKTYSSKTTASSNLETQDRINVLKNSKEVLAKSNFKLKQQQKQKPRINFDPKTFQSKISEEHESMISQSMQQHKIDSDSRQQDSSKISRKTDNKNNNNGIDQTLIDFLNKIEAAYQDDDFIYNRLQNQEDNNLLQNIEPIFEAMNDQSISDISLNNEKHELDFVIQSEESLENELQDDNHLNKAFIIYGQSNNLNISNTRLTYNSQLTPNFSRQISSLSKATQSNYFLAEQSCASKKSSKNDQILIIRMPSKASSRRLNYVKVNYQ